MCSLFVLMSDADAPTDQTRARQRLAMLRELAEIGMRLARDVERQAEEPQASRMELGLVFVRIARAVRQTLALEARMQEALATDVRKAEVRRAEDVRAAVVQRAKVLRRTVTQAIEADADDADIDHLAYELEERLADRQDDTDFLDRPVSELIARICKTLGVTPDWSLWEDEAWTKEEAVAQAAPPAAIPPDPPPEPVMAGTYWQPSAP